MRCFDARVVAVWSCAMVAHAGSLGTVGPTYEIAEPDFVDTMKRNVRELRQSPAFKRRAVELERRRAAQLAEPAPVAGVTAATAPRVHYFDPSLVLSAPIADASGRVLYAAGTRYNPLDQMSWPMPWLFFDGRDAKQVKSAEAMIARHDGKVKLVLVGGAYAPLMLRWQRPVYFDQNGQLVRQLGIRQVPALVRQDGKRLRIDEFPPGKEPK